MTTLTAADLGALARGAAVLGTGGGGDPHIGRLLAEQALRVHGPVEIVSVDDLPDDACVLPVAMMGAPTVMVEKLPSADQIAIAVRTLAKYVGKTPTHIACIEAGGVNSTVPVIAAAQLGLPLVDGDGMGRAFPELQMVLPTLAGIEATPMSIVDEKGNRGVFDTISNAWAERLARSATVDMGCSAIVSLYAMTGAEVRASFVPGTLSQCLATGRAIDAARRTLRDPVAAVVDRLGGRMLHVGKVVDVQRRTTTGFARGDATVDGLDTSLGRLLVLRFQNEHLVAEIDGAAVTTTPDLIIVLDTESGEPITTEALRYGQRVSVLAAPSDERWHSPAGIELVGPRYFGYDLDPIRALETV
ncbi:DUF917 domain-containing protein [Kribbella turkmenica]|uniref:DUF917 domain-containing protein n=1 Tax=Kribbella turkmenica TaxID=2530375 RepID=A0A4R4WLX3_9ACTN|nr:DUF917 domain-containing protein [Kribbella turkmenica]TDD16715.1 DUF917 domain-containing protein [Kribbella turkmenica]